MNRIKTWIQRLLLFLLKKLNMPRQFSEFSTTNMLDIERIISTMYRPVYLSIRVDKNNEYAVLEYAQISNVSSSTMNTVFVSPTVTINVGKDYQISVSGLQPQTTTLIKSIITDYLTNNGYL